MTIDGENIYNSIRSSVNFEKYSPDRLIEMWRLAFGGNEKNNIRREKFKNVGGVLTVSEDSILEGVGLVNFEEQSLLSWNNEGRRMHLRINNESFIGVQNHEGGEKSVVVMRSSADKLGSTFKQTVRRFTAVKE